MISVIIPAHNEERYLTYCLDSIKKSSYSAYEIIVVCNGCSDATERIARRYTSKVYVLKDPNVCTARNVGAKHATGTVLLFVDADCILAQNLLACVDHTIRLGYCGGTTKTLPIEPIKKAQFMMWLGNNICNHLFLTAKGIMFCRKEVFPGFDETINIAEDTYFLLALKKRGAIKYITNSYIQTSMRRFEHGGYVRTIAMVCKGFFWKGWHSYKAVR